MRENVGTADRIVRSIVGPAIIAVGYSKLRGHRGRPAGLLAMIGGALIAGSAITRVSTLNTLFGIDTR